MQPHPRGCLETVLLAGGALGALLVVSVAALVGKVTYDYQLGFDQQRWKEVGNTLRQDTADVGVLGTDNPRETMVGDVMAHHLRPGMTRAQVVALLGPPEREGIEWVVPDSVALPDSLDWSQMSSEAILRQSPAGFNEWHRQHAQPDTIMRYRVGWDSPDVTSLRVEFAGNEKVRRYWVGLH